MKDVEFLENELPDHPIVMIETNLNQAQWALQNLTRLMGDYHPLLMVEYIGCLASIELMARTLRTFIEKRGIQ